MKHETFFHFTHICLIRSSLSEDWFSGFLTLRTGIDLQQLLSQEIVALVIEGDCRLFLSSSRRIFLDSCGLAWLAACPRPTTGGFEVPGSYTAALPGWWAEWARFVRKEELVTSELLPDLPAPACPWQAGSIYSSCLRRISETSD